MDLLPPHAPLVMETTDTYKQFWWGGVVPVTTRIPLPGKRCWRHQWVIEEYPSLGDMDRDKVCRKCGDRRILKARPYRDGEAPDFRAQVAAAMRSHISHSD